MTTLTTADVATETITPANASIEIDRASLKKFLTVACRVLDGHVGSIRVTIARDADGLHYLARYGSDVRYTIPEMAGEPFQLLLYGDDIAQIAGTRDETAILAVNTYHSGSRGEITWRNGKVECRLATSATREPLDYRVPPMTDVPGLPELIEQAESCTDQEATRYALRGYLIDGRDIVATDSRQLLVLHNALPAGVAPDRIIIPAFGLRSAIGRKAKTVAIGRNSSQLVIQSGQWTFRLDSLEGRFPAYRDVIRDAVNDSTHLAPSVGDMRASKWLKRSPGTEVQIALNGTLQYREIDADADDFTHDHLPWRTFRDAVRTGDHLNATFDAVFWHRGMSIRPEYIGFYGADAPAVFRSPEITYLAMPLCK